jgi:hypothetical protein
MHQVVLLEGWFDGGYTDVAGQMECGSPVSYL